MAPESVWTESLEEKIIFLLPGIEPRSITININERILQSTESSPYLKENTKVHHYIDQLFNAV
jgi:hypothetical protein